MVPRSKVRGGIVAAGARRSSYSSYLVLLIRRLLRGGSVGVRRSPMAGVTLRGAQDMGQVVLVEETTCRKWRDEA